jgi:regulatory protein
MASQPVALSTQPIDLTEVGATPYWDVMERAFKLLAIRPRTEHRLRERLMTEGVEPAVVDEVLARLVELELVDDLDFARRWIEEHSRRRLPLGAEALIAGLEVRGIRREITEQALAELGFDDRQQAIQLAAGLFHKVAERPLAEQGPRLMQMLTGRGFSEEVAEEAARSVLPPEGWD